MGDAETIQLELEEAAARARELAADPSVAERVARAAAICAGSLGAGGKILAVGNGGSCADAVHFCEELTGRYRDDRPPIAAIACSDAGHITCTANDYGYDHVFARWIEGLARPGDVVVALSTSGNSENVVRALVRARELGCATVAMTGQGGGRCAELADALIAVPSRSTPRIQEIHITVGHMLCDLVEKAIVAQP